MPSLRFTRPKGGRFGNQNGGGPVTSHMDMMTSIRPKQFPKFSERWLMIVLAETLRAFSSAVIWLLTLPCAALAMACVVAWDAMRGLSATAASPVRISVMGNLVSRDPTPPRLRRGGAGSGRPSFQS